MYTYIEIYMMIYTNMLPHLDASMVCVCVCRLYRCPKHNNNYNGNDTSTSTSSMNSHTNTPQVDANIRRTKTHRLQTPGGLPRHYSQQGDSPKARASHVLSHKGLKDKSCQLPYCDTTPRCFGDVTP